MMSKELVPTNELAYSSYERDATEARLTEEANLVNMEERKNNGMNAIIYLLRKEQLIYIECTDERTGEVGIVYPEPGEVYETFHHVFAYAELAPYEQRQNGA